ncbi:hypothetical protein WN944_024475 [Citrus x changshan-huyou]|uniref:K Homology domain-containing protein n=1 Tax=Citrus x changshan-huyou TaxID=2935761 RepID=A0AAP0QAP4_9ROSI
METSNSLRSRVTDADVTSFRGLLSSGFKVEMSLTFLRLLSSPTCPFIEELGKQLSFEIVVGLNGLVWANAESPSMVVVVSNANVNSESLSAVQQKIIVDKLLQIF